jgi:hypothetical protein
VEEGVSVGDTKVFLSHAGCRGGLDLKEGTDYLIMGPKTDLWYKDSSTNRWGEAVTCYNGLIVLARQSKSEQ